MGVREGKEGREGKEKCGWLTEQVYCIRGGVLILKIG